MPQTRASLLVAAAAFGLAAMFTSAASAQSRMASLLDEVATPVIESPGDKLAVARRRSISFSEAGLDAFRNGRDLQLNLFADVSLPVLVDTAWRSHVDTWHWQGHVPGEDARTVLLVLHKGHIWGTIDAGAVGEFRIRSHRNQGQVVEEFKPEEFHPCGCGPGQAQGNRPKLNLAQNTQRPDGGVGAGAGAGAGAGGDGGLAGTNPNCDVPIIDVMVVYSPEAEFEEGGPAAMQAIAIGLEDATNLSYENSDVLQRIQLVHVTITGSELTGFSATLNALTNTDDGNYDEVHALRDEHGADLVAMLISHTNGGICGIAWLMGADEIDPTFAQYGFSVTNTGCATGGYTFQHELGHNMGCHHDHDNAGGTPAFPWSYGHRFTATDDVLYRTIMSYAPGQRISHFSNPDILYQGTPTGVPQGTPGTQADNAASLDGTSLAVESFRAASPLAGASTWPTPSLISSPDPNAGDRFGVSSAISGDLAIIGAYTDDEGGTDAGAAYVFAFDSGSGVWEFEQKLIAPDAAAGDRFGISVDVIDAAGDGDDVVIVGSYLDDHVGGDSGSAYVFRRAGGAGSWAFEHKLVSADLAAGDFLGRGVALAIGGGVEWAIVGAPNDDDGANGAGSAYIFEKVGAGAWTQATKLVSTDPAPSDSFGQSVDIEIAPDGDIYALVGNWRDDDVATNAGSASVYRKAGAGAWQTLPKLVANDAAAEDQAGFAVALAFPDATTVIAVVGAWKANSPAVDAGVVYIFADTGSGFAQEIKLIASDTATLANFGVAVDAHQNAVIVGAYGANAGALGAGAAYIYRRDGVSWLEEAQLVSPDPQIEEEMGFSVAIDGTRAFAGSWQRDADGGTPSEIGGVWLSGGSGGGPGMIDCNQNGEHDFCDILLGTSPDNNGNGIPDECELPPCPPDVTDDGFINVADLLAVISSWGPCPTPPTACPADIAPIGPPQGDGNVNVSDLLMVISNWGVCP